MTYAQTVKQRLGPIRPNLYRLPFELVIVFAGVFAALWVDARQDARERRVRALRTVCVWLSLLSTGWTGLSAPAERTPSCESPGDRLPALSTLAVQSGRLAPGESTCFAVPLEHGELVRIWIAVEIGYVSGRVFTPGDVEVQRTWTSSFSMAAPSPILTVEATESGVHVLELSVPTWVGFTTPQEFRVQLVTHEPAAVRSARREATRLDPRVDWLAQHAQPLRTLDPNDRNFEDLAFLRTVLRDTRVVLLGEGDNGGGSDVMAKTRLVKFLHEEMGFDVIAFLAGIHSSTVAWRALQTDGDPRQAMRMAMGGLLWQSMEAEPLIQYLAARSRSSRPIELTGFDSQFTGTAAHTLLPDLQRFLRDKPTSISFPLADSSAAVQVLAGVLDGRYARDPASLPSIDEQAYAVDALRRTARELERGAGDQEHSFWAQVLRSTATQVELVLGSLRGTGDAYFPGFVRQTGENLVWLLNTKYANRKVIVWAHTVHAMRAPEATSFGRSTGHTVGEAVWQALGQQSYSIGLTSYQGASHWITQPEDYYQSVIPNQHPDDALESLMAAAGHDHAFLDLRGARAQNQWPGGRITTNALYLVPQEAEWSKALDALLFIRTQEPRRRAR